MKKKAMGYARIHIYIPAYLYDKIEEHKDILKGRLSAICQKAIENYIEQVEDYIKKGMVYDSRLKRFQ